MQDSGQQSSLKLRTARTLKWNAIDRFASQILYAVTGVVLANILSKEDFGLVGALLIFQAFASIFVDGGFGSALLQKKTPTEKDYSTVFWFNLAISIFIYFILFLCAPIIADIFQGDRRLIPLSKVMFLSFVVNGLAIVQTNRLMKKMDVRNIAVANTLGLAVSGTIGIWLAIDGYGVWALVWQTLSLATVKTVWLWIWGRWVPAFIFSMESLKQIWRLGISVMSTSVLNTICLNIYNFVVGAFYNLVQLGVYTQADKWSKMVSASLSQIMTSSFVPLLSKVQDDSASYKRYVGRINRMAAFVALPVLCGLAVVGAPLFHILFGQKWDEAIPLFQILISRGIFVVFISLYNNYLLSLGKAKHMIAAEAVKDILMVVAILCTVWFDSLTLLVGGQLVASAVTYIIMLVMTSRAIECGVWRMIKDIIPFALATGIMLIPCLLLLYMPMNDYLRILSQLVTGSGIYIMIMKAGKFPELKETAEYVFGRFLKRGTTAAKKNDKQTNP